MGGDPYHLYFQICFYANVITCGNSNLTTWIASTEIELEKESPRISNRSLVSTMEWNLNCSDRAHCS